MIMRYTYKYITSSTFSPAIGWHFFKLRAVPCTNEFQRVVSGSLEVMPHARVLSSVDGLGNAVQWGSIEDDHTAFRVESEGEVEQLAPYVLHEKPAPYYLTPTHLTTLNDADQVTARLRAEGKLTDKAEAFALASEVMRVVNQYITYTPAHTTTSTTAAEVWADPRGVCQDYAHVMIALCRALGLHARYANGLIVGEGQTHAWVEVSDGRQWQAFDPTHNVSPQWGYIKIAHGRDADDCPTNRGRFYAWTCETQTVLTQISATSPAEH